VQADSARVKLEALNIYPLINPFPFHRGEAPRPLVRVQADSAAELLEALTMLRPASRLGEFCYLFGAATTAVLQRVAEQVSSIYREKYR